MKPIVRKVLVSGTGKRPYLALIAALLSMVGLFTIDTHLPSFPDIEPAFGSSRTLLSQSVGIFLTA